jgi:hypothetical protein
MEVLIEDYIDKNFYIQKYELLYINKEILDKLTKNFDDFLIYYDNKLKIVLIKNISNK